MNAMVARRITSGATLTAATATAMMIASTLERRARARFDPKSTPVGLAVLAGGLIALGLVYRVLSGTASSIAGRLRAREAPGSSARIVRCERIVRIDDEAAAVQRPPADS